MRPNVSCHPRCALTLVLGLLLSSTNAATIYCVATNGSDSDAGTEARPWKTLRKAAASVQPGDTVRIKAGDYFVGPTWIVNHAGTAEAPITYQAYGDGAVRITGSSVVPAQGWTRVRNQIYSAPVAGPVAAVFRNDLPLYSPRGAGRTQPSIASIDDLFPGSYFISQGTLYVWLEDGSDPGRSVIRFAPGHVISLYDCHHTILDGLTVEFGLNGIKDQGKATHDIVIRHCTIRSIASQGIQPVARNCLIESNLLQKIGLTKFEHGIYCSEPGIVIRSNVFEEIAGAGIHQFHQGDPPAGAGCEFSGNLFRKPRKMIVKPDQDAYYTEIIAWGEGRHRIFNNTFLSEGKRSGISLNSVSNQVCNNTFVDCASAIQFHSGKPGNLILSNVIENATKSFLVWPEKTLPQTLDFNLYQSTTSSPRWQRDGKSFETFTSYQNESGEVHSRYEKKNISQPRATIHKFTFGTPTSVTRAN